MTRKVGTILGIGWLVLVLGIWAVLYGVASFSGTMVPKTEISSSAMSAEYRWNGEPIAIKNNRNQPRCEVHPDSGTPYKVKRLNYPRRFTASWEGMKPQFSGSATIKCDESVTVYSGWGLQLLKWLSINPVHIGLAIVAGLPLMLVWVFGPTKSRK